MSRLDWDVTLIPVFQGFVTLSGVSLGPASQRSGSSTASLLAHSDANIKTLNPVHGGVDFAECHKHITKLSSVPITSVALLPLPHLAFMPSKMVAPTLIPIVDLAPYLAADATSEAKEHVVTAVCDAARTYGFFSITGHGIPLKDQETTLECAKRFFDLPVEDKMSVFIENAMGTSNRGYEVYRGQTLEPGTLPDMKEGFVVGAEIPREDPDAGTFLTGPNQWPQSLRAEEFEKPVLQYRDTMVKLAEKVLRILALGLPEAWNCPPDVFDEFFINPSGNLRLLHYPPQVSTDPRQLGAGAHTDFGGITFLLQQPGSKGLEVFYPPTKSWVPVPVTPDSYVVNIGDLVQKWTAGYYRSAVHRVINFGDKHRYSAPFFLNGNMKLKIQPLNGSGQQFGVRDHFMYRLKTSLGQTPQQSIESI